LTITTTTSESATPGIHRTMIRNRWVFGYFFNFKYKIRKGQIRGEKAWSGLNPQICFPSYTVASTEVTKPGKRHDTVRPNLDYIPPREHPGRLPERLNRTNSGVRLVLVSLRFSEFCFHNTGSRLLYSVAGWCNSVNGKTSTTVDVYQTKHFHLGVESVPTVHIRQLMRCVSVMANSCIAECSLGSI
jgi:hypothetical protein